MDETWSLPVKYEWNPGWQGRWGLWLSNNEAEHFCPLLWSCPDPHLAQPPYQVFHNKVQFGGGVAEDAPVKAAHISQPHTLPTIQACGAGRASKTGVRSTTIFPQQEGQEGLMQQKAAGGEGPFAPPFPKCPFVKAYLCPLMITFKN